MKKNTLLLLLIGLLNIQCSDSTLSDIEKDFEGAWVSEMPIKDGGESGFDCYLYLELNKNNTGKKAFLIKREGKKKLGLPSEITNWAVHKDTLIVESSMTGGKVSIPGKKDTIISSFHFKEYWIIKNKKEEEFEGVNFDPQIPLIGTTYFVRSKVFKEDPFLEYIKQ